MHRCGGERQRHRQHRLQGNEADVDDDDIGPRGQPLALEFADIGFFHRYDPGVIAQRGMQLAAPDIDGEDEARAVLQQHLGEAAGGGADVEADMALDLDRIQFQGAGELDAAARDPGVRGLRGQFGIGGDHLRRFQHGPAVGGHAAGVDRGAGAGAAFEQAALDQQHVHALAGRSFAVVLCQPMSVRFASVRFAGGAIRRKRDAGLERGEIVPDIRRPLPRRHQSSTMQIERVDHHEIVGQAEIFHRQSVIVDQMAASGFRDRQRIAQRARHRRRDRCCRRNRACRGRPCSRVHRRCRRRHWGRETA